jgi:hypothetical protein
MLDFPKFKKINTAQELESPRLLYIQSGIQRVLERKYSERFCAGYRRKTADTRSICRPRKSRRPVPTGAAITAPHRNVLFLDEPRFPQKDLAQFLYLAVCRLRITNVYLHGSAKTLSAGCSTDFNV